MSFINDIVPKFYMQDTLSDAELELILPKNEPEPVQLMLDDMILVEDIEPSSDMIISHQGFQKAIHTEHDVARYQSHHANENPKSQQQSNNTQVKVSLFDEFTQNAKYVLLNRSVDVDINKKAIHLGALNTPSSDVSKFKILHPALLRHHYQVAANLLKQGYEDPHGNIKLHSKSLFSMMMAELTENISTYVKDQQGATLKKIENNLEAMELFAKHAQSCLIPDFVQMDNTAQTTYSPVSMILRVYASLAPDHKLMSKLLSTANVVAQYDSSETAYLNAKHLLHMFPTGKTYDLKVGKNYQHFQSEGSFGLFTTKLAKESLEAFVTKLQHEGATELEITVFSKLVSIFDQAAMSTEHRALFETALELESLYHQENTVLLPSGWQGHFFDIALSKAQSLYLFANSGENVENNNVIGDTFRKLSPESIDASFIYDVLTNSQKGFENSLFQKYDISEPIDHIERETQKYNNCTWESHRDAVEGLLYIELLNQNVQSETAKSQAKTYYQQWDNFHGEFVIDNYMKNSPSLPAQALIDMLDLYQHDAELGQHTQRLEQALKSPLYADEYQAWIEQPAQAKLEPYNTDDVSHSTIDIQSTSELTSPSHAPDQSYFSHTISPLLPLESHPELALVC